MSDLLATFNTGPYKISQLSKLGVWLVETEHLFDLGMLFLRVQEFYESPNPAFCGKSFKLIDYMRWYSIEHSSEKSFTYFSDFEGFNIPSEELEKALQMVNPDPNNYDLTMSQIFMGVKTIQNGPFYLLGARSNDKNVLRHEIAHSMFYLLPKYREQMTKLVEALPERTEIEAALMKEGYGDRVLVDETQAYLATGLLEDMAHLESIRFPFMKVFEETQKKLFKQPRIKKPKEVPCPVKMNIS